MTETKADTRPDRRAAAFARIRDAHQTEVAEDYVELIDDLIAERGEARLVDVSAHMGVTHATAAKIIARLKREGLVLNRPYRSIFLTEDGTRMANMARQRHRVVFDFLRAIGIDRETAEADSEGMEHHASDQTLAAMERLTAEILNRRT
ncbi:manganese transporter [Skermanella stibiiresistens SB22]|uniref:Transcriptional regulator MntR n=1 Tax=Skermanella stibiiresistens SB22 TaxID=1385369 RepID=W9GSY0_9PROT|nr:manganese-binding transcriptional regulator MntR [Skermanella stibiiresistens]EWY36869.1 manganese transporter [Skermanella stibiiresistens SB22]